MKKIHQTLSSKQLRAFSLMEMSFILLALSLILAAIPITTSFVRNHKVVGAQALTNDAPVHNIEGLVFWLETSKAESFFATEGKDGRIVNTWRDINPQSTTKINATSATAAAGDTSKISYNQVMTASTANTKGPTYVKNGINDLPSLNFDNSGSQFRYMAIDANSSITPTQSLVMFFVVRFRSGAGYFIDRICRNAAGIVVSSCDDDVKSGLPVFGAAIDVPKNLLFMARSDQGTFPGFYVDSFDSSFFPTFDKPYIIMLEREIGQKFRVYVNGVLKADTTDASGTNAGAPISVTSFKIGRGYNSLSEEGADLNFDLSEIMLFNQSLKDSDRKSIEDYLGKKYGILVRR